MEPVCLFASAKSLIDSLFALCAEAETGGKQEMKPSDAGEQLFVMSAGVTLQFSFSQRENVGQLIWKCREGGCSDQIT